MRGFLRYLITVLTGGPLTHMDEDMFLCQGRDLQLGPRGKNPNAPLHVFLGRVVKVGSRTGNGRIELGDTALVPAEDLERACHGRLPRPQANSEVHYLWADYHNGKVRSVAESEDPQHKWQVKLSGRPVSQKGVKKEGLFRGDGTFIDLPPSLWGAYLNRHRHGDHPELKKGDLVWLEPKHWEGDRITCAKDITSVQWARWGRKGENIKDVVPEHVYPDWLRDDGKVGIVTDLFGQVSPKSEPKSESKALAFAGRIRPENLVFHDAAKTLGPPVPLPPLAPPHPGCIALYRNNTDPNSISNKDGLKGYKVYRTTEEDGESAPWLFSEQGVYDDEGRVKDGHQKLNKSAQLLPAGQMGMLRIAFRALSRAELALLVAACRLPWRLGGGKPLGLGRCNMTVTRILGELGEELSCEGLNAELDGAVASRARLWETSQQPVSRLRYPRAASRNRNKINRGGHAWFQKLCQPKKAGNNKDHVGMEPLYVCDGLMEDVRKQIKAAGSSTNEPGMVELVAGEVLPPFNPADPDADALYGYDAYLNDDERQRLEFNCNHQSCYPRIEPFDPAKHVTGKEKSGGFHGQNRDSRGQQKKDRRNDA